MKILPVGYLYETTNLVNGKLYVGISYQKKNWKFRSWYLGSGKVLRRAVEKYGRENFSARLLKYAFSLDELSSLERITISEYKDKYGSERLYNLTAGGIGGASFGNKHALGHHLSDEHKAVISLTHRGRKHSETQIANRAAALHGKKRTPEQRARMSNAHKGVPLTPEHLAARVAGQRLARTKRILAGLV